MRLAAKDNRRTPKDERTFLVLDIENGSAGSALVRLTPEKPPKLFGEKRLYTPLLQRVTGSALAQEIERATHEAIRNTSEVAARIRQHPGTFAIGSVTGAVVCMSSPWGKPNLSDGEAFFLPEMEAYVRQEIASTLGDMPVSFFTAAGLAAFGAQSLFPPEPCLVCLVTGEVTEILRMDGQGVVAHASVPTGVHSLLRTLQSHAGLSEAEARSAIKLGLTAEHPAKEAMYAAAETFTGHVKTAAQELLTPGDVLRVRVLAAEPVGEWFGKALSIDNSLADLFPEGGEVRAIRSHHLSPYLDAHAEAPDLLLMLQALFVDSHFNS